METYAGRDKWICYAREREGRSNAIMIEMDKQGNAVAALKFNGKRDRSKTLKTARSKAQVDQIIHTSAEG